VGYHYNHRRIDNILCLEASKSGVYFTTFLEVRPKMLRPDIPLQAIPSGRIGTDEDFSFSEFEFPIT